MNLAMRIPYYFELAGSFTTIQILLIKSDDALDIKMNDMIIPTLIFYICFTAACKPFSGREKDHHTNIADNRGL